MGFWWLLASEVMQENAEPFEPAFKTCPYVFFRGDDQAASATADVGAMAGQSEFLGQSDGLAVATGEDFGPVGCFGGCFHIYVRIYKRGRMASEGRAKVEG